MGNISSTLLLILLLITSCGKNLEVAKVNKVLKEEVINTLTLEGQFLDFQGEEINLNSKTKKPVILIFASSICSTCYFEAVSLTEYFDEKGSVPKNVDIITIMIGGAKEKEKVRAQKWVEDIVGLPWVAGINPGDDIFKKYCSPSLETPCLITYHPKTESIKRFIGEVSKEKLQEETETWEF